MKDLADIWDDSFTAPINGKTYRIPAPTAHTGLTLRVELAKGEDKLDKLKWINTLFGGKPLKKGVTPSGGLWDELTADGVGIQYAMHLGMTAIAYFGYGQEVADIYWESLGKPAPETPETMETEDS